MKRLEQQVDPQFGTPAGLYPHAAPVHVNTPPIAPVVDPRQIGDVMRNLAGLTAQLGNLKREADNEADELAMTEFNGYRIKREREMLAEFAELDINDQSDDAIRSMSESFGEALDDYAKTLPFSERRREVVNALVRSYQMQNSGRLKAESLANKARWINTTRKRQFDEAVAAADIAQVRELHNQMTAKGQDPGMTLEQAVSGAARNQYLAALPTLDAEQLDQRIDFIREELGTDKTEFAYDDSGNKIGREDLAKVLHAAKLEQHRRYDEADELKERLRADGDFSENKVEEIYAQKGISARQKKAWLGEIAQNRREVQRGNYADQFMYMQDLMQAGNVDELAKLRVDAGILAADGSISKEQSKQLRDHIDRYVKAHDKSEAVAAAGAERKRIAREKALRTENVNALREYIVEQAFKKRPGADRFDAALLAIKEQIQNADNLTSAEKVMLRKAIGSAKDAEKLLADDEAKGGGVNQWFLGLFAPGESGTLKKLYNDADGWGVNYRSQELQRKAYRELRNYALGELYKGTESDKIIEKLNVLKKQLNDDELAEEVKYRISLAENGAPEHYKAFSIFDLPRPKADHDAAQATTFKGLLAKVAVAPVLEQKQKQEKADEENTDE